MSVDEFHVFQTIIEIVGGVAILGLILGVVFSYVSMHLRNARLLTQSEILISLNMVVICMCLLILTVFDEHRHSLAGAFWFVLACFCFAASVRRAGRILLTMQQEDQ